MTFKNDDLMRVLGNLEGTTKQILDEVKTHHDRMNRIDVNVEDMDERLRGVEKRQYTIFVIAMGAWTLVVGWLTKHFS